MRIFLDTANIDQIRQAAKLGIISGITTNPSLVSQEATADYQGSIKEICSIIPGPVKLRYTRILSIFTRRQNPAFSYSLRISC